MSIYIAHRHRKTCNTLDTLVLTEQKCFHWTSERLVTTRRIMEVSWQRIANSKSLNVRLVSVMLEKTLRTHVGDVLVQTEVRWYRHAKDADVVTGSNCVCSKL